MVHQRGHRVNRVTATVRFPSAKVYFYFAALYKRRTDLHVGLIYKLRVNFEREREREGRETASRGRFVRCEMRLHFMRCYNQLTEILVDLGGLPSSATRLYFVRDAREREIRSTRSVHHRLMQKCE